MSAGLASDPEAPASAVLAPPDLAGLATGRPRLRVARRVAAVGACVVLAAMAAAWLAGWRTHVMTTASMGRTAPVGTLVISRPASARTLAVGQIVAFHPPGQPDITVVHRVRQIVTGAGGASIHTRGDINGTTDPWVLHAGNLIGRVVVRVPVIGFAVQMLPAALAALLAIILVTLTLPPARRRAARILLGSLAAGLLLYHYRPLARIAVIAQTVIHGHGIASVVPTGILPLQVRVAGGSRVNLVAGQVGTVRLAHVTKHGMFTVTEHVHLSGWWWLVIIAWLIPLIVSLKAAPPDPPGATTALS